jgi:hypothetical protein
MPWCNNEWSNFDFSNPSQITYTESDLIEEYMTINLMLYFYDYTESSSSITFTTKESYTSPIKISINGQTF